MSHQEIALIPMRHSDLPILQAWFEDAELRQRLRGMLPLQNLYDYMQSEANYFAWLAWDSDTPVGAVFLEFEPGEQQAFAFLVNPALRAQGYGRLIVQEVMAQPELASVNSWKVGIERDNIASQRCLASVGFVSESGVVDEDGFLQYVFVQE